MVTYWFWDDEKRKIIHSKNVVFNQETLYKDKVRKDSEKKKKKLETVDLSDIMELELQQNTTIAKEKIDPETLSAFRRDKATCS